MKNNWPDNLTIQQYLQGTLDKERMHELEKKALDDPFLSDALEGYNLLSEPDQGLSILQRQLHKRIMLQQENKKVFDLTWQRLSVAAAAAVIFISAGILFWMNSQVADKQLASNTKNSESVILPSDTVKQESTADYADTLTETSPIAAARLPKKKMDKVFTPMVERKTSTANSGKSNGDDSIINPSERLIADRKDRISDAEEVYVKQKRETLTVDDSSASSFRRQKLAEVTLGRFAAAPASLKRNSSDVLRSNLSSSSAAAPEIGWEAYQEYLRKNIAKAASSVDRKGKVMVGFRVDEQSVLSDIKILKGLSPTTDSLAVKLIKTGPKWKAAVDGQVSNLEVELEF